MTLSPARGIQRYVRESIMHELRILAVRHVVNETFPPVSLSGSGAHSSIVKRLKHRAERNRRRYGFSGTGPPRYVRWFHTAGFRSAETVDRADRL